MSHGEWTEAMKEAKAAEDARRAEYDRREAERYHERVKNAMTVGQLVDALWAYDSEAIVWADGCDCTNPVVAADEEEAWASMAGKMVTLRVST